MNISRRTLLKSSAAASTVLAAPAILKASDALASSGQVNVFAWGDYIQQNMIDKFEGDTGIKINLSTYGSNDEAEQKLRAAGGKGFDVIFQFCTMCIMMVCCVFVGGLVIWDDSRPDDPEHPSAQTLL